MRENSNDDKNSKLYDYDLSEHVIVVNDFSSKISSDWHGVYAFSNGYNLHNSILVNGLGIQTFNETTVNSSIRRFPIASFRVKPMKRYRFRLIHVGPYSCSMIVSIDNHKLTLIATDGNPVEPVELDSIMLSAGERYDFVVETKSTIANNFIKFRGEGELCGFDRIFQVAKLEYENATNELDQMSITYDDTYRAGRVSFTFIYKKI